MVAMINSSTQALSDNLQLNVPAALMLEIRATILASLSVAALVGLMRLKHKKDSGTGLQMRLLISGKSALSKFGLIVNTWGSISLRPEFAQSAAKS